MLINSVIARHSVSDTKECFEKCTDHNDCKSVNQKQSGLENCQLNNNTKLQANPSDFIANDMKWNYYATNYATKNVCIYFSCMHFSHSFFAMHFYDAAANAL